MLATTPILSIQNDGTCTNVDAATFNIIVVATDDNSVSGAEGTLSCSNTIDYIINVGNSPPYFTSSPPSTFDIVNCGIDDVISFTFADDDGDSVVMTAVTIPPAWGGTASTGGGSADATFTVCDSGQIGQTASIDFVLTDNNSGGSPSGPASSTHTITFTVVGGNTAPQWTTTLSETRTI